MNIKKIEILEANRDTANIALQRANESYHRSCAALSAARAANLEKRAALNAKRRAL